MKNLIEINKRKIGAEQRAFVIAEIGINHNGDIETAKKMIDQAKWAGADAVKLQTYITEKRVPKNSPIFGILKQCELTFRQQEELVKYAHDKEIIIFSTPFDNESVDFLASVDIPCYKIASFDIVNKKLLEKVALQSKPVIMSRGMADQAEIDAAVGIMNKFKAPIILLHCISAYPVPSHKSLNLNTIRALKQRYDCPVGFSDHTLGIDAAKYAIAAGAELIEKHFTLSRKSRGPDHALSTEPKELRRMIKSMYKVREMMGQAVWSAVPAEEPILQYRRSS